VAEELEQKVLGRIPIEPDATGEPGRSLFEEGTAPAGVFDEIAASIAQTKVRRRLKVL
jgi:ATP-binding protein involved in chromosome partitioning